ncbi:MAG TPA: thiamine phosphate synthase [Solirubrobacteraceae bacterium]
MAASESGAERRARLQAARLYLVVGSAPEPHTLPDLLRAAAAGGVDIVELREKDLPDGELAAVANAARALCERIGLLLTIDDRPAVALEVGADGVHLGEGDMAAAAARELLGPDVLIGRSAHSEEEIAAADPAVVDYISVGPVHESLTKPGRAPVGTVLVRYAATHARVPFFAVGGLDAGNVSTALDGGAQRVAVSRAVAAAQDPERAARAIREQLGAAPEVRP